VQYSRVEYRTVKDIGLFVICKNISLFLSKFLFLSFSHRSWTEKVVVQRYSTSDRPLFGTLWAVSIEGKDNKTWISCTSNPFTLLEFSVPGRFHWHAVWTRRILPIHYELSKPFDQVHNSSSPEQQNGWRSGLSADGYLFCMFSAPFILQNDNGREFANNTELGWYVARNEART